MKKTPDCCSVHRAHSQPYMKPPKFGFENTRQTIPSPTAAEKQLLRCCETSDSPKGQKAKDTAMETMSAEI